MLKVQFLHFKCNTPYFIYEIAIYNITKLAGVTLRQALT